MEKICRDLEGTVQLLAVSQSRFASQWDAAALHRAFRWARYCQELHARFHADTEARRTLESVLGLASARLGGVFGQCRDLEFADLARCEFLLCSNLMQNPAVHQSAIRLLLDSNGPAFPYLEELIGYKAATRLLSHAWESDQGFHDPAIATQGRILRGRLDDLMLHHDSVRRSVDLLDSILQECEGERRQVAYILAAALLSSKGKGDDGRAQEVIADWLQRNRDLLQTFCRVLPVSSITQAARVSTTFREAYRDVLKSWAHTLRYDINEGQWVQTSEQAVSFGDLVDRFRSLLCASPSLRKETEKVLMEMKAADGDFEVRGLSVSSDVLTELKHNAI
ncbi:Fanconi anemia group F protein [Brienomyrus brachyistius]|uniref:Fanconi anemia group F protein n=1 Tax=Brienomyrus brachyistius TaxID=42636 RepID=UPI0020B1E19D|nr:Fanconi anemia group F protein [Brienomyrus brachyistius]